MHQLKLQLVRVAQLPEFRLAREQRLCIQIQLVIERALAAHNRVKLFAVHNHASIARQNHSIRRSILRAPQIVKMGLNRWDKNRDESTRLRIIAPSFPMAASARYGNNLCGGFSLRATRTPACSAIRNTCAQSIRPAIPWTQIA